MLTPAPPASPGRVKNMAAMTSRLGLDTAPAAWPADVSLLAQVIEACQQCDAGEVCSDWLVRAPKAIAAPPAFCPNAPKFARVKKPKEG